MNAGDTLLTQPSVLLVKRRTSLALVLSVSPTQTLLFLYYAQLPVSIS